MLDMKHELTADEITAMRQKTERLGRLAWNETEMNKAARSVASSLKDIHEKKLWQDAPENYTTFEDYCHRRWGISRQRAYQMMNAQNTRDMLADAFADEPEKAAAAAAMNDRQAEAMASVPEDKRKETFTAAQQQPGKMTATKIKQTHAKLFDAATGKEEQQEFSFTIKASPEHREDAEWFSKLAEADRANIIAAARRAME